MLREGHNKGDKIGAQHNNSPSQGLTVDKNAHETSRTLTNASCISVNENFEEMPKVMELEGKQMPKELPPGNSCSLSTLENICRCDGRQNIAAAQIFSRSR